MLESHLLYESENHPRALEPPVSSEPWLTVRNTYVTVINFFCVAQPQRVSWYSVDGFPGVLRLAVPQCHRVGTSDSKARPCAGADSPDAGGHGRGSVVGHNP